MVGHTVMVPTYVEQAYPTHKSGDAWAYDRGLWCPCTCNEILMSFDVHVQAMARVRAVHLSIYHPSDRVGLGLPRILESAFELHSS